MKYAPLILLGMGLQAAISAHLSSVGLIELSPGQQAVAGAICLAVAILLVAGRFLLDLYFDDGQVRDE